MRDHDEILACLGGLFHDMGKIGNRGNLNLSQKYSNLDRDSMGWNGAHAKWSAMFVDEVLSGEMKQSLSQIVLFHHNPMKITDPKLRLIAKIVQIADWISSSERLKYEDQSKYNPKRTPLLSVFSYLRLKKRINVSYSNRGWIINKKLYCESKVIPKIVGEQEVLQIPEELKVNYHNLYNLLINDFKRLNNKEDQDFYIFTEKAVSILQKYCSTSPQATYVDVPDISLFDHLKTTAAIALCICRNIENEEEIDQLKSLIRDQSSQRGLMTIIYGDLSGIQKFIYTIRSKSALKSLKGRSSFLSLLSTHVAEYILKELNLPITNLLYSSGGNFYILSALTEDNRIEELQQAITEKLLILFEGDLYLSLSKQRVNIQDIMSIGKLWEQVINKTYIKKASKFAELVKTRAYEHLFTPRETTSSSVSCFVCNRRLHENEAIEIEGENWCRLCVSFVDLGKSLKSAKYISYYSPSLNNSIKPVEMRYEDVLNAFGTNIAFNEHKDPKTIRNISLNFESEVPYQYFALGLPLDKDGNIIDLDNLVKGGKGPNKLAILKMDIDDLGLLFSQGLGFNQTFSRVATFSRMISFFFEGYINTVLESEEFKNKVYLVYSGGDDTLLLGRWDKIFELSYQLYYEFRQFTCNNPHVTLSTAITLINPKFPISRAVELVSKDLDRAKEEDDYKNRISLFGIPLTWNIFTKSHIDTIDYVSQLSIKEFDNLSEFSVVYYLKEILFTAISEYGCSRSILSKIESSAYGLLPILHQSASGFYDVPKVWRLRYYLRDYEKKDRRIQRAVNAIIHLYELMVENNLYHSSHSGEHYLLKKVNMIKVAIKWADLLTRKQ